MTAPQGSEKRARARANLKMPLAVYELPSRKLIGHAIDISAGGLGVYSEDDQAPQTALWASISLPMQRGKTWQEVTLKIEPVWSRYDEANQTTAIGFKFLEIEPKVLFAIQKLMDDHSSLA